MVPNHSAFNRLMNNKTNEDMAEINLLQGYSDSLLNFAYVCCVIFTVVGIPGNLITIVAMSMCEKFRNATAYFIINLHINNLIYCCMILPMTAAIFSTKHWIFGITMCSVYPLMKYVLVGTAHFTVVAITVNRYIIVCHPHIYHRIYKRKVLITTVLFTWIAPLVMFLPTFFKVWGKFDLDTLGGSCTIVPDANGICPKTFFVCFAFVGPYLIITICYSRIWWTVRKAAKRRNAHINRGVEPTISNSVSDSAIAKNENSQNETSLYESCTDENTKQLRSPVLITLSGQENSVTKIFNTFKSLRRHEKPHLPTRKDKKLATMILAILIAFVICHLPLMMTRLVYGDYKSDPKLNILAHLLEYSAAFTSPLIYVVMSREYRQVYSYLFRALKDKITNYYT